MSHRTSEFTGGHERHCLRRIQHALLFDYKSDESGRALSAAIAKDSAEAKTFLQAFEAALERAVSLKPTEEADVLLAVKAELDRLFTVSASLSGDQRQVQEALARLTALIMQSIEQAAGDEVLAMAELQDESAARQLHYEQLKCTLLADLLNSDNTTGVLIPSNELIPTLLCAEKVVLADAIKLFDLSQVLEIIQQAHSLLARIQHQCISEASKKSIEEAQQNLVFIKGYKVYLEDYG